MQFAKFKIVFAHLAIAMPCIQTDFTGHAIALCKFKSVFATLKLKTREEDKK